MKKQTLGYETDKKDSLGISVKSARAQNNIDTTFFCLYYMGVAEHIEKEFYDYQRNCKPGKYL